MAQTIVTKEMLDETVRCSKELIQALKPIGGEGGPDSDAMTRGRLSKLRDNIEECSAYLRAALCKAVGVPDTGDLSREIGATMYDIQEAPIEHVAPLVRAFTGASSKELLEEYHGREKALLALGQALVSRFMIEAVSVRRDAKPRAVPDSAAPPPAETQKARTLEVETQTDKEPVNGLPAVAEAVDETSEASPAGASHMRSTSESAFLRGAAADIPAKHTPGWSAAIILQKVWRGRKSRQKFDSHLADLLFNSTIPSAAGKQADVVGMADRVSLVQAVQLAAAKILEKLSRHHLDMGIALAACRGSAGGTSTNAKELLTFILEQQRVRLLPAEAMAVGRLFESTSSSASALPGVAQSGGGSGVGKQMQSSFWQAAASWPVTPSLAQQFEYAFRQASQHEPEALASNGVSALEAVRGAVRSCQAVPCAWCATGVRPSWRRLLLDAHIQRLLAERSARCSAAADRGALAGSGAVAALGAATQQGELEAHLASCEKELEDLHAAPVGKVPVVAESAFVAKLLQLGLQLPPVTIHAAARAASEENSKTVASGSLRVNSSSTSEVVTFAPGLAVEPRAVHITACPGAPWTVELKSMSTKHAELFVSLARQSLMPGGDDSGEQFRRVRIRYEAGTATGSISVDLPKEGPTRTSIHFVPRLPKLPSLMLLETSLANPQGKKPGGSQRPAEQDRQYGQLQWFSFTSSSRRNGFSFSALKDHEAPVGAGVGLLEPSTLKQEVGPVSVTAEVVSECEVHLRAKWSTTPAANSQLDSTLDPSSLANQAASAVPEDVGARVSRPSARGFAVSARMLPAGAESKAGGVELHYEVLCLERVVSVTKLDRLAHLPAVPEEPAQDGVLIPQALQAIVAEARQRQRSRPVVETPQRQDVQVKGGALPKLDKQPLETAPPRQDSSAVAAVAVGAAADPAQLQEAPEPNSQQPVQRKEEQQGLQKEAVTVGGSVPPAAHSKQQLPGSGEVVQQLPPQKSPEKSQESLAKQPAEDPKPQVQEESKLSPQEPQLETKPKQLGQEDAKQTQPRGELPGSKQPAAPAEDPQGPETTPKQLAQDSKKPAAADLEQPVGKPKAQEGYDQQPAEEINQPVAGLPMVQPMKDDKKKEGGTEQPGESQQPTSSKAFELSKEDPKMDPGDSKKTAEDSNQLQAGLATSIEDAKKNQGDSSQEQAEESNKQFASDSKQPSDEPKKEGASKKLAEDSKQLAMGLEQPAGNDKKKDEESGQLSRQPTAGLGQEDPNRKQLAAGLEPLAEDIKNKDGQSGQLSKQPTAGFGQSTEDSKQDSGGGLQERAAKSKQTEAGFGQSTEDPKKDLSIGMQQPAEKSKLPEVGSEQPGDPKKDSGGSLQQPAEESKLLESGFEQPPDLMKEGDDQQPTEESKQPARLRGTNAELPAADVGRSGPRQPVGGKQLAEEAVGPAKQRLEAADLVQPAEEPEQQDPPTPLPEGVESAGGSAAVTQPSGELKQGMAEERLQLKQLERKQEEGQLSKPIPDQPEAAATDLEAAPKDDRLESRDAVHQPLPPKPAAKEDKDVSSSPGIPRKAPEQAVGRRPSTDPKPEATTQPLEKAPIASAAQISTAEQPLEASAATSAESQKEDVGAGVGDL